MPRRIKPAVQTPQYDWYLQEWMEAQDPVKTQAELQRMLEVSKGQGHNVMSGKQRYNRDLVNQISAWLHIRPYELLMHPQEAMAIRQLRVAMSAVAADVKPEETRLRKAG